MLFSLTNFKEGISQDFHYLVESFADHNEVIEISITKPPRVPPQASLSEKRP